MKTRTVSLLIVVALGTTACSGGDSATTGSVTTGSVAPTDTAIAFGQVDTGTCTALFGAPTETTGLDSDVCRPELVCRDSEPFIPPTYEPAQIEAHRSRTLLDPPGLLPASPYDDVTLVPVDTSGACAVLPGDGEGSYRLATFANPTAAEAAGGTITHTRACGQCSSLQDLSVYLSTPDLGGPVRECALLGLGGDPQATLSCITDLGFTEPCAQIWAFNSAHTKDVCLVHCLANLDQPHQLPDGTLNPCIACDEAKSGPVFKAIAGRTRRNSGIPSGICRPGDQVSPILHTQYPGEAGAEG
ncbi:hypothetical protein HQ535_05095 [bacterium]|nr:hypothetical protein [bacterium]